MTRKDYVAIAKAFKAEADSALRDTGGAGHGRMVYGYLCAVAVNVADVFEADNPRFDRDRFIKAAGFPVA